MVSQGLRLNEKITIYDPKAMKNTRNIFGEKIVYARSIVDALNKSQCVILMTHWKQFERFNNNSMECMSKKFIIDCRRILVEKKLQAEYHAIGIGKT